MRIGGEAMTKKTKGIIAEIIIAVVVIAVLCFIGGCSQRIYQHDYTDPNGVEHTYFYQSNSLMSDTSADEVEIVTKDGTVIRVRKPLQDNDSIKVIAPYGIYETTK
jgi:major membrane immunogen (membrane-anchored lipoprotein)